MFALLYEKNNSMILWEIRLMGGEINRDLRPGRDHTKITRNMTGVIMEAGLTP
jgi:hypothetical protein